ncbi:hypothetical protein LSTR_LSTR002937 [Laodelphax striatellus]|uniref:Uncharacterized protein n=1 Tax=Laodelphax striatellus TaxID=195883 RepID=A0A482XKJ8_LAOST|nr:hypothetical protein LSTR_LSTR002937 [Laodelphax striatellus]
MTIIGSSSRFVAGRNAMQTIYWRAVKNAKGEEQPKLVKTNKTFSYPGKSQETSTKSEPKR